MTVGSLKLRFLFQVCSPSRDFGVWADGVCIHHQGDRAENDQQDKMIWTDGNKIAKIKAYEIILSNAESACDRYLKSPKAEIVVKNVLLKMNKIERQKDQTKENNKDI